LGITDSDITSIQLLNDWVEAHPYFGHCAEVFKHEYADEKGWILIHQRNVCVIVPEYVEVLSEYCNPENQYRAKWIKIGIGDPEFFTKLEMVLKIWI